MTDKSKITDAGQYEIMDRTYMIITCVEAHLLDHDDLTVEQGIDLEKALKYLNHVYQSAGKKALK